MRRLHCYLALPDITGAEVTAPGAAVGDCCLKMLFQRQDRMIPRPVTEDMFAPGCAEPGGQIAVVIDSL